MKYFGKISVAVLLVTVMLFSSVMCVGAATTKGISVAVDSKRVNSGGTFTLDVNVTENSGVAALKLVVEYDTEKLTLTGVENGTVLSEPNFSESFASPYGAVWLSGTADTDVTATGKLMTLTFTSKEVENESTASVSVKLASANDCVDSQLRKVKLTATSGSVTLLPKYDKGDVDGNKVVDSRDAVYLLYNTIFGDGEYPLTQPADFNGDGVTDADDAVYLLFFTLFGEAIYPLQ